MRRLFGLVMLAGLASAVFLPAADAEQASASETSRARQLGEAGRWPEARDLLQLAARRRPDNAEILFQLGVALEQTGDYGRALEVLEVWQRLTFTADGSGPRSERIVQSLRERREAANRFLKLAREKTPDPRERPAARRLLRAALAAAPRLRDAWLEMGQLALAQRSWQEACVCFRKAIEFSGESPLLCGYLALALASGAGGSESLADEAYGFARRAVILRGAGPAAALDNSKDLDLMGVIRYNQGQPEEAASLFRQAAALAPGVSRYRDHLLAAEAGRPPVK